jgi:SAM-dependent methyltransferase
MSHIFRCLRGRDEFQWKKRGFESAMVDAYFLRYNSNAARAWDEQYTMRTSYWRGPYDITPIVERIRPGASILDVGCGSGRYLIPLERASFDVLGIDISGAALRSLTCSLQLAQADLTSLPFACSSFDAVTCFGVLQHLSYDERKVAARELYRVLKPKGLAFVEVIGDMDMRYNCGDEVETGTFVRGGIPNHHFSSGELSALLEVAGFATVTAADRILERTYDGDKILRHSVFTVIKRAAGDIL